MITLIKEIEVEHRNVSDQMLHGRLSGKLVLALPDPHRVVTSSPHKTADGVKTSGRIISDSNSTGNKILLSRKALPAKPD